MPSILESSGHIATVSFQLQLLSPFSGAEKRIDPAQHQEIIISK